MQEELYPIFLKIADKKVLVVGAGEIAYRKVMALLKCDAKVTVIAPEVCEDIAKLYQQNRIYLEKREFKDEDMNGCFLVVASTSDRTTNEHISSLARQMRIFINVVDVPDLCDFYVPSIVDRSPLKIAISTSGMAPAFARKLRKELEAKLPENISGYIIMLGQLRETVRKRFPDLVQKAGKVLAASKAFDLWLDNKTDASRELLEKEIEDVIKKEK